MYIPSLILFIIMYIWSFVLVLNIDDWIIIWLGLELNMMSYVILIYKKYDMYILESCVKYFLIQSLGSVLLLSSFYLYNVVDVVIILLLSYSLGAGPFFYWFTSMCSGLEWMSCFVLMTFQKVMPLFLMSGFLNWMMWYIILMSLLLGVFGSFNQVNIKQLFAYSSIHHLGWLISCIFKSDLFWLMYLLIYSFMLISLMYYMKLYNIYNIYMLGKCYNKWWVMIGLMSMGGMPPLLGFFLKWCTFLYILHMSYMYVMFLLVMSVIMLYIYIRMVYDMLMLNSSSVGWSYNFNMFLLVKLDYLNFFGLLLGVMMGLLLVI